jgi:hypothetical protein
VRHDVPRAHRRGEPAVAVVAHDVGHVERRLVEQRARGGRLGGTKGERAHAVRALLVEGHGAGRSEERDLGSGMVGAKLREERREHQGVAQQQVVRDEDAIGARRAGAAPEASRERPRHHHRARIEPLTHGAAPPR